MSQEIKPGKYRHCKGNEYEVLGVARHTETKEWLVVYRALYDNSDFSPSGLMVRPVEMFLETVMVDGREVPRFELIELKKD